MFFYYFSSLLTFHFVALVLWSSGSLDAKVTKDQDCSKLPIPESENLKVYKLASLKQYKLFYGFKPLPLYGNFKMSVCL